MTSKPPRSVWVSDLPTDRTNRVSLVSRDPRQGWTRYDLHRPARKARKGGRGKAMSADAGGVRLFRNLKTGGFWRSDPGCYTIDSDTWLRDEAGDAYVAYPAAQAAAMERVVEAARPAADWLESGCYCPCCEQRNECVEDCTYADDAPAEWARMVVVREVALPLIKALATLPTPQSGERKGE